MRIFDEKLNELAALPPDWDSYGSPPPTAPAIETARRLLRGIHVYPVSGGGIQIDLGEDFCISIEPDGKVDGG